jgi:alpha-amylase
VPLPDLNTENSEVISKYSDWISDLVQTYSIDGLRIDAAKYVLQPPAAYLHLTLCLSRHVRKAFWPAFAKSAGVFCMGEVFDPLVSYASCSTDCESKLIPPRNVADFQGSDALDSVLNYPLYYALVAAFTLPGAQNMSALVDNFDQSKTGYSVSLVRT